jgi:hypothetical protein
MAKRRRRKRRRRPSLLIVAVLALLIAGFLARRVMMPTAMHYLTYRPPESPSPMAANPSAPDATSDAAVSTPAADARGQGGTPPAVVNEHVTQSDRAALDAILKRKSK